MKRLDANARFVSGVVLGMLVVAVVGGLWIRSRYGKAT